jgi:predicted nucleic acid-binding protein
MKCALDTNILIHYLRQSIVWKHVEKNYLSKGLCKNSYISFAVEAEAEIFARANHWDKQKMNRLDTSIRQSIIIHSNFKKLKEAYVQIDWYSQNRHKSLRLPRSFSVRNMGKNDFWIAATTHLLQLPLISTDRDFEHLGGVFFDFIYIDPIKVVQPF